MSTWADAELIKAMEYGIEWYRLGKIEIISSDGDMRRIAVDMWANLLREIIQSKESSETLYLVLDLTGTKQGTTPYSTQITRGIAQYLVDSREGNTYASVLMKNELLVGIINAIFHKYFARQEKLVYRLFTDKTSGLG